MRKLPNPRSSTLSPFDNASVMLSKTVLTIVSVSFLVRFATFETSSIRSALVIVRSRPDWGKTFAWELSGNLAWRMEECQPAKVLPQSGRERTMTKADLIDEVSRSEEH